MAYHIPLHILLGVSVKRLEKGFCKATMRGKQKVWEPTIEKNSSGNDSINFTFIERE